MVPGMLAKLREGLARIDYPPELSQRFFDSLMAIHGAALQGLAEEEAAAPAPTAAPEPAEPWLAGDEAQDSGWLDGDSVSPEEISSGLEELAQPEPHAVTDLRTGTWAELLVNGQWTRVQLTWASPHGTLFMFTALAGTAHSMSRRTMDRLRANGALRIVAERNVVDDALDQVAKAALKNSLRGG